MIPLVSPRTLRKLAPWLNLSRIGKGLVDDEDRYRFCNQALAEINGGTYTAGEHIMRPIVELYPGLYPEAKPRLERARAGELVQFRFSAPMPAGEIPFVGTYIGLDSDWVGATVELDIGQVLDKAVAEVRG